MSSRPDSTHLLFLQKHRAELWDYSRFNVALYEATTSPGLEFAEATWSKDTLALLSRANDCIEIVTKDLKDCISASEQLRRCFISFSPNGSLACIDNRQESPSAESGPKIRIIDSVEAQQDELTDAATEQKCIVDDAAFEAIARRVDFNMHHKDFCLNLYNVFFSFLLSSFFSFHFHFVIKFSLFFGFYLLLCVCYFH